MHCGRPLRSETEEFCHDCRKKRSYIRQGRSVWLHCGPVQGAVYRFKYQNKRSYGQVFAAEMERCCGGQMRRWEIDEIMPVPLHPSRKRMRGYNQAEILAAELSIRTGIPLRNNALFRIKKTVPQKELDDEGRRRNLMGAFGVSTDWIPCRNVLLIDDIYTTGSTVERCAKMLKKAGGQNVYFLTISIGQGL